MFCCQKGFPETPETPPLYALGMAVKNQWNGMVEWNTGMEHWNGILEWVN